MTKRSYLGRQPSCQRTPGRSQRRPQASVPASSARATWIWNLSKQVGAPRYERGEERLDQRNGTRSWRFDTRMGTIDLRCRAFATAAISRRSWSQTCVAIRAIIALVPEAIISGVSTRKILTMLAAELGITSISKSVASEVFQGVGRGSVRVP